MLRSLLLTTASTLPQSAPDFSQSYGIWVSVDHGECIYWLTDVGENASQLTYSLTKHGYQKNLGLEILTSSDTPKRCVSEGWRAALDAGFQHIRTRLGTDKDRHYGIP